MTDVRALTLHQAWASLIAVGAKTIETRSWSTKYRGRLLIHAGLHYETFNCDDDLPTPWHSGSQMIWNTEDPAFKTGNPFQRVPLGAVVASCTLIDCVPTSDVRGYSVPAQADRDAPNGWCQHEWGTDGLTTFVHPSQEPFGDFTPGRFAWLLGDVKPTSERCPRCWGECDLCGSTEWTPYAEDASYRLCAACAHVCAHHSCICDGQIGVEPVPMKGHQGLWNPTWGSAE